MLTGGTAVRMDGADKASLEIGGRTLLEGALAALAGIDDVVVVGEEVPTSRPVTFRREDPPGAGPAAAVLAGIDGFARRPSYVVVLAVDMPRVTAETVHRLRAQARGDGAVLVDGTGRRQHLCAVYAVRALEARRPENVVGLPMHRLLDGMSLVEVAALGGEAEDVDTWADVARLRELGDQGG